MAFWREATRLHLAAVVGWAGRHRTTTFLLLLIVTIVLQQAGVIGPGDWWGNGMEVGR